MLLVAVTGGISDGKSTVVGMFEELGAAALSADKVARELLQPGQELVRTVLGEFPEVRTETGEIDRTKLANVIAVDDRARRRLNRIMHPAIMVRLREEVRKAAQSTPSGVAMVEIPLLIEIAAQGEYDRVIVVQAGESVQLERLTDRLGNAETALRYLRSQLPTRAKCAFGDWVIGTNRSLETLRKDVNRIWTLLTEDPRVG